jgi:hypothetical protein
MASGYGVQEAISMTRKKQRNICMIYYFFATLFITIIVSMANRHKQSPGRDEICRKYCVPDGTLILPENLFSTNILSLPGHCDVDMTLAFVYHFDSIYPLTILYLSFIYPLTILRPDAFSPRTSALLYDDTEFRREDAEKETETIHFRRLLWSYQNFSVIIRCLQPPVIHFPEGRTR